jgi:co-chaperonin GroES (HSP10)
LTPRSQVGDRILFGKYSGSDIKLDGDEYMVIARTKFSASWMQPQSGKKAS